MGEEDSYLAALRLNRDRVSDWEDSARKWERLREMEVRPKLVVLCRSRSWPKLVVLCASQGRSWPPRQAAQTALSALKERMLYRYSYECRNLSRNSYW